jgi:D-tyrosyl-tRNA(Tyr) deacylase
MRAVVQRVAEASVSVGGNPVGDIGRGLLVFLGVAKQDTPVDIEYLADKVIGLRIFEDDEGKMNRSVAEVSGGILVVSQFTLYGDARKGRRPSFDDAAPPHIAKEFYELFVEKIRQAGVRCETGRFQETMQVSLVNEGPVTIMIDSRRAF